MLDVLLLSFVTGICPCTPAPAPIEDVFEYKSLRSLFKLGLEFRKIEIGVTILVGNFYSFLKVFK